MSTSGSLAAAFGTTSSAIGATAAGATVGLPLAAYALYDIYKTNHEMTDAQRQTAEIVKNGGHVGFDKDGNLLKDANGNLIDVTRINFNKVADPYAYMNGNESYYSNPAPAKSWKNLFGLTQGYKDAYAQWEAEQQELEAKRNAERQLFYDVQSNYYSMTGNPLTYMDYVNNKDSLVSQYGTVHKIMGQSIGAVGPISQQNFWKQLSDFNVGQGGNQAVQDLLGQQLSITPQFTMEAPQIQVDVTIDGNGNVISQKQSILNPDFSSNINYWYHRVSAQNGSTTK
jgi:hypothetical protein